MRSERTERTWLIHLGRRARPRPITHPNFGNTPIRHPYALTVNGCQWQWLSSTPVLTLTLTIAVAFPWVQSAIPVPYWSLF